MEEEIISNLVEETLLEQVEETTLDLVEGTTLSLTEEMTLLNLLEEEWEEEVLRPLEEEKW